MNGKRSKADLYKSRMVAALAPMPSQCEPTPRNCEAQPVLYPSTPQSPTQSQSILPLSSQNQTQLASSPSTPLSSVQGNLDISVSRQSVLPIHTSAQSSLNTSVANHLMGREVRQEVVSLILTVIGTYLPSTDHQIEEYGDYLQHLEDVIISNNQLGPVMVVAWSATLMPT